MLYIDTNGNIKVNKGDTFQVPLFIDISNNIFSSIRFPLHDNDKIVFNVLSPNTSFYRPLLTKEFGVNDVNDNGDIIVRFEHADTAWLPTDTYYYEVKLIRTLLEENTEENEEEQSSEDSDESTANKIVATIIPRRKLVIM